MHHHDDDRSNFVDLHVRGRARLGHLPALDGLRGLAVAGVVAFHAGFDRMVGGYLGVSTFFTLSGFLITSLLLAGSSPANGIRLRGFWGRRIRRLYPASVVTLLLVLALFAPFVATADQLATMRGDVLAALANVANWHFILAGSSYADLFAAPSPVLHFWSLAIEEQFYLVFPLALWAIVRLAKGRRSVVGAVLALLAAASLALTLFGGLSDDHIYFGTGTRASELLLGGVLAVVLSRRHIRQRLVTRPALRATVFVVGAVALLVQLWWWWTLGQATGWLYRGGFTLYAAMTCLVITAAAIPAGPVYRSMRVAPMRWLGARSYAIYLVHWPLFLVFRQTWGDANRWILTAAVVALSLLIAELSYRVLERPIRLGSLLRGRSGWVAGLAAALAVVVLAFTVVPNDPGGRRPDLDANLEEFQSQMAARTEGSVPRPAETPEADAEAAGAAAQVPPDPADAPVPVVAVFGDSTALGIGMGLAAWGDETGRVGSTLGDLKFGCGVPRYTAYRAGRIVVPDADCLEYPQRWADLVASGRPDVAFLSSPAWTVVDAELPGSNTFSELGDPEVDAFVRDEFLAAVDTLSADGTYVLLVQWPHYGEWADDGAADSIRRQADPARMDRLHEIQAEVAAMRPGRAAVIDLAGWMGPEAQDPAVRSDGVHFDAQEGLEVSREWLGPEVERLWQAHWADLESLRRATATAEPADGTGN